MRRELAYLLSLMLIAPEGAYALGLGTIQRKSALNEPFNATIKLLSARAEELDSLKVRLADPERFQRAGLERSDILSQLRFEVIRDDPGSAYIKISSQQPIRDPFLNLLLEVSWSKGRIFREYTVLLDPPLYDPGARIARQTPVPSDRSKPGSKDIAAAPAEMRRDKPYPRRKPRLRAPGVYGPTAPGDTLSEIAVALRPDRSTSVNQVMLALLRSNPQAFFQDNINNLHKGMVLRLPDIATIKSISQAEALAQVQQHYTVWEQYRSGIVAAPAPRPIGAGPAEGRGEGTQGTALGLKREGAHLKLVSPSDTASVASQAVPQPPVEGADKVQNELTLAREDLETLRQENAELNTKLAEADNLIKLLQRKLEINDDEFAALQAKVGAGQRSVPDPAELNPPSTAPGAQTTEPAKTPAELAVKPEVQPGEKPTESTEREGGPPLPLSAGEKIEPSTTAPVASPGVEAGKEKAKTGVVEEMAPKGVLEALPGGVITLVVILAILVLGLLAALITHRLRGRKKAEALAEESRVAFAGRQQATKRSDSDSGQAVPEDRGSAVESPMLSQPLETAAVNVEKGEVAPLPVEEEEDPLAEVNIYLAYERFDQAAEVVKQAIQEHPDKPEYKLRLLEVYYAANDKLAYEDQARSLYDAVGGKGPLWESALAMWREMSPGRALFTREVGETPVQERGASTQFIDITHSGEALAIPAMGATLAGMTKTDSGVDFDLTAAPDLQEVSAADRVGEAGSGLDFDLTADPDLQQISAAEDPAREGTVKAESELDFDLTAASQSQGDGENIEDIFDLTSASAEKEKDRFDISMANIKPALEPPALASAPDMRDISLPGEERLFSNLANPLKFSGSEEDFVDFSGGYFDEEGDIFDLTASGNEWPKSAVSSSNESDLQAQRDSSEQKREDKLEVAKDDKEIKADADAERVGSEKFESGEDNDPSFDTVDLLNMKQSLSTEEKKSLGDLQRLLEDPVITSEHPVNEERGEAETEEPEEEMDIKLNLAKAYMELGDVDGARSILDEVTQDGTEGQKKEARQLLNEL
jgi:pilus assembly protein FimV